VEVVMSLKPICVKCQRFYRVKKNGVMFIEGMPKENGAKPGKWEPEKWEPYKLWRGDLWKCEGCNHELISGVAFNPIDEHYTPTFEKNVEAFSVTLQINDC
jgi:hypothetical protein